LWKRYEKLLEEYDLWKLSHLSEGDLCQMDFNEADFNEFYQKEIMEKHRENEFLMMTHVKRKHSKRDRFQSTLHNLISPSSLEPSKDMNDHM
jgi:hypothetical protein